MLATQAAPLAFQGIRAKGRQIAQIHHLAGIWRASGDEFTRLKLCCLFQQIIGAYHGCPPHNLIVMYAEFDPMVKSLWRSHF